jgi:hypothetical protein
MILPSLPTLLFALLLALLLGALYHLLRGGGAGHLLAYLFMSVLGFVVGHLIGIWREWVFFPMGPLNLGMEAAGSLAFLALADWLLHLKPSGENQKG